MEGKKEKRIFLPQLFQNHMMLQREKPLRFYGEADEMVWKVSVEYTSKTGEISGEKRGGGIAGRTVFVQLSFTAGQMWEEHFAFM